MGTIIGGIFNLFENIGIASLAMRIILFSVLLRLLLFPLDYFSTRAQRRSSRAQESIAPQLEKIKKQFANDNARMQQEQQKLMKSAGVRPMAMCLPMILTMVVFMAVLSGFNGYTASQNEELFKTIQVVAVVNFENPTESDRNIDFFDDYKTEYDQQVARLTNIYVSPSMSESEKEVARIEVRKEALQFVVLKAYDLNRNSFLWVTNLARPDTFWAKTIETYSEYLSGVKDEDVIPMTQGEYELIVGKIIEQHSRNGLLVLPILSAIMSFLMSFIMMRKNTMQAGQNAKMMKIMQIVVMPLMMAIFALQFAAAFAIYIVVGNATNILTRLLINFIIGRNEGNDKKDLEFDRPMRKA